MKKTLTKFEEEFGLTVNEEGQIIVSSRIVAEKYGKEHKNVLAKIDGFIKTIPELGVLSFKLTPFIAENGETYREYLMDRQGFSILVNKFNGEEALKFTVKYTKAFEEMAEEIEHIREQKAEIENKLHTGNKLSLEDYNKIRFSEKRTIKTFEFCVIEEVKQLVEDFVEYADALDTKKRVIRCNSVIKGLQKLHDRLAKENVGNIGDCYNLLRLEDNIKTIAHITENRTRGQKIAHRNKRIRELESKIG